MGRINITPCGLVQLGGTTVPQAWRTLRRFLEAVVKPVEKSKPFTQQKKPFALSWAWEHTLCLPLCSLKNKSFTCSPSSHPLPWHRVLCLPSGMWLEGPDICTAVLRLFFCAHVSDLASELAAVTHTHTHTPPLGRGLLSPCSQLRVAPLKQELS